MAGYLDHYGEGDERREKRTKRIVLIAVAAVVLAGTLYFGLRNYRQKAKVTQFAEFLQKQDYKAAYSLWGCTDEKPCKDYVFEKFLEDWGPKGRFAQVSPFRISKSRACGSGVIVTTEMAGREERFWVEGSEMTIGFSPWPVCPPR